MTLKHPLNLLPGIILAFILYSFSEGLNNIIGIELLGYEKSPISTAMIAIILGLILGNIFNIREGFLIGLDFTQKNILKLGIICLGIQLKPFEFIEFGSIAIPLIVVCIISVLIVIKLLIQKLKISHTSHSSVLKQYWHACDLFSPPKRILKIFSVQESLYKPKL